MTETRRGLHPLVLALWLALAAGLIEGAVRLVQRFGFGKMIGVSSHVIWTAPLANLALFGVAGLVLWGFGRLVPHATGERLIRFGLVSLALASVLLLYQAMHKGVIIFLAAAAGWQLAGWMGRSAGFPRLVRRSIPILVLVAALSGITIAGVRTYREWRAPAAVAKERLNVLLIILDTVRGENLSVYGYDRPTTPFLERVAAEGTRFDRAMATAPWTLPSHASMFTGRLPVQLRAQWRTPLEARYPVLAETFNAAGYRTGGFVANTAYGTREHGLARGFARYEGHQFTPGAILNSSRMGRLLADLEPVRRALDYWDLPGRKDAWEVNETFLDWAEADSERPFFAFLNYFDAHQPYLPPEPYRSRFVEETGRPYEPRPETASFEQLTAAGIRTLLQHYDASIALLDDALAALLGQLQARGVLDRTLVIVTSDHGEQFGEHRKMSHGNSLYRQVLQVPLLVRLPGTVPAGRVVRRPVSLVDLPRTILGLAGIADSALYPGRSLARVWDPARSRDGELPVVSVMYGPRRTAWSLVEDGYHFVQWFGQDAELYDLNDARETENLATQATMRDRLSRFSRLVAEYSSNQTDQEP
jgi:arylsulfatase A-like enzyme